MADPLSFVASILAITQLAAKLTCLGYGYVSAVKRAPDDLMDLMNELLALSRVLSILQVYADSSSNAADSALYQLNGANNSPLQVCSQALEKLLIRMEPKDGFKGFISNMKWPLEEKETTQHIARIERHKTLFMFALQADQISLSKVIELYTENIDAAMQTIQADISFMNNMVKEVKMEIGRTNSIVRKTNDSVHDTSIALSNLRIKSMEEFMAQEFWREKQYTQGMGKKIHLINPSEASR
ncbi:uncharacterized protein H6S33_007455 [Morchella sextelata]|uniref:uncharacterized protein n=1 Tax=Morchella sextelata TaxID=1174677 RepID=UPI001D03E195|nr:uncharacterized protein H6S33_007455 [Morchella sextelata]KAH0603796.1 hypothetical protein H6S33_007455 [Morchella sextelata]